MNFEINNKNILKFVVPCMMTMVFTSIFVMSDGIIASNFINETALAAINLVLPITSFFLAIGLMFGSGINAICSKLMGEGKIKKAREAMSLILIVAFILGIFFTILIQFNISNILNFLGTSDETYPYAYSYLKVLSCFSGILMIQTILQNLMVIAGKAFTYFKIMMTSGILKIILGITLVNFLGFGIEGIAFACALGYFIPAFFSFLILLKKDKENLYIAKPSFDANILKNTCLNGSSEMVTNLATAITTFLFNYSMLKLIGDSGVSAVTIILYTQFLLSSIFMGYSIGIAPVIGYNYGKKDSKNLNKIFKISLKIIAVISIISFLIGFVFSGNLAGLFASSGTEIYILASSGLKIFSIAFIFMGLNIYASGMFTAYSNGKVSAFISVIRTVVLISSALMILPNFFGVTGVWIAIPVAEFITIFISFMLFKKYENIYMYGNNVIENKNVINNNDNLIITLNRAFGSGGKEIAKRLSDELKIAFYDEDIINDVLNEQGLTDAYLEKYSDVNFNKNYNYKFATSFTKYNQNLASDIFEKHAKIIKDLSKIKDSVFVGNCANYVLEDVKPFNIYIYTTDEDFILNRLIEKNKKDKKVSKKELLNMVEKINLSRNDYYKYYTGKEVSDLTNYDLVIDVSKFGIKETVKIITNIIKKK